MQINKASLGAFESGSQLVGLARSVRCAHDKTTQNRAHSARYR